MFFSISGILTTFNSNGLILYYLVFRQGLNFDLKTALSFSLIIIFIMYILLHQKALLRALLATQERLSELIALAARITQSR